MASHSIDVDSTNFREIVLEGSKTAPVVIDFWAPWCAPCLSMAPAYAQAAVLLEPRVRLAKVDTQAEPALGTRFDIRSIPTLALFLHGRELARQSGAMPLHGIMQWAGQHLPPG